MAQPLLEGAVDDRDSLIAGQRLQIRELTEELGKERGKNAHTDQGLKELRSVLAPLYGALKRVFGEMDDMGVDEYSAQAAGVPDGRKSAVWDSWKQKLPGIPAKFIDALLLHGGLTQTQLRLHAQCAKGSVASAVSTLHKAGIINKNGGKISLKDA